MVCFINETEIRWEWRGRKLVISNHAWKPREAHLSQQRREAGMIIHFRTLQKKLPCRKEKLEEGIAITATNRECADLHMISCPPTLIFSFSSLKFPHTSLSLPSLLPIHLTTYHLQFSLLPSLW